jgi:hypothetical protein
MSLTSKESAEKLIELYKPLVTTCDCHRNPDDILTDTKQCALIAAKLILQQFIEVYKDLISLGVVKQPIEETANYKYWDEVKSYLK